MLINPKTLSLEIEYLADKVEELEEDLKVLEEKYLLDSSKANKRKVSFCKYEIALNKDDLIKNRSIMQKIIDSKAMEDSEVEVIQQ